MSASEKRELIRLVEGSSLPVPRTLAEIGLSRSTFYAWYKRYLEGGPEALEARRPRPRAVRNRISDPVRAKVIETALAHTELSPRELACRMTDRAGEFLSESTLHPKIQARRTPGGIEAGSAPDGIGDACQCGDANEDGRVTATDSVIITRSSACRPRPP